MPDSRNWPSLRVLDLFAGLEGWSAPWRERGHEVYSVDNSEDFDVDSHADILTLTPEDLPWEPDVILASPPCEKFSVMTFGRYWLAGYRPAGVEAETAIALVRNTVALIEATQPAFWVIENPRGMLRKLGLIPYERQMVTYCQYGRREMKPTDLWGGFPPSLALRYRCFNYDPCHDRAPRGWSAKVKIGGKDFGGTQGMANAEERAKIPYELALDVCLAAERDHAAGLRAADYTGRLFA